MTVSSSCKTRSKCWFKFNQSPLGFSSKEETETSGAGNCLLEASFKDCRCDIIRITISSNELEFFVLFCG